jgi:hypothetical protein
MRSSCMARVKPCAGLWRWPLRSVEVSCTGRFASLPSAACEALAQPALATRCKCGDSGCWHGVQGPAAADRHAEPTTATVSRDRCCSLTAQRPRAATPARLSTPVAHRAYLRPQKPSRMQALQSSRSVRPAAPRSVSRRYTVVSATQQVRKRASRNAGLPDLLLPALRPRSAPALQKQPQDVSRGPRRRLCCEPIPISRGRCGLLPGPRSALDADNHAIERSVEGNAALCA